MENRTTSADLNVTRMSTFVLGDVLQEDHNNAHVSIVDWEYFRAVPGSPIEIQNNQFMYDPMGSMIYISTSSKARLGITY